MNIKITNNNITTAFLELELFAEHKSSGSSSNGRDSKSKRLGLKLSHGAFVKAGGIIVTQRGTKFLAGKNVFLSRNHTIHSYINGFVFIKTKKKIGKNKRFKIINVLSEKF